jgi:carbamate kinase
VEFDAVRALIDSGFVVITVGGGGIPVIEDEKGNLTGTYAVIDKDRASSLLAQQLKADLFLISTGVPQVAVNFNKPDQKWLDRMTAAEARAYQAQKQFPAGSMGPKIEAVIAYLDAHPAGKALITDPPNIARALDGQTGTWIEV